MPPISLQADPSTYDYNATCKLLQADTPGLFTSRNSRRNVMLGILIAALGANWLSRDSTSAWVQWLPFVVLFVCLAIALRWSINARRAYHKSVQADLSRQGLITYDLTAEGLRTTGTYGHTLSYWTGFTDAMSTHQGIVLPLIGDSTPPRFVPIPAPAFATRDDQDTTAEQIKTWIAAATA